MTSSHLNEMHDAICVNLYRSKSLLNSQKTGVTGAFSITCTAPQNRFKIAVQLNYSCLAAF